MITSKESESADSKKALGKDQDTSDIKIELDETASDARKKTITCLVKGEKNYHCKGYLVNLEEVETTHDKEKRAITSNRVEKLINQVNQIFIDLAKNGKEVGRFYIGKTYVAKRKRIKSFDTMNPNTWRKDGVIDRWTTTYKKIPYDGLIVLTVITKELLPPTDLHVEEAQEGPGPPNQETYALMLEQRLIHYYRVENYDPRIMNSTFNEGKKTDTRYIGYPLYVAFKFKE